MYLEEKILYDFFPSLINSRDFIAVLQISLD